VLELLLVRHGQTLANVEGHWTGWSQTPLTELGLAQIEAVAQRIAAEFPAVDALYASPQPRAFRTAQAIGAAASLEPVPLDDLREIDFGDLDGISLERMEDQYPELFERWKVKTDVEFAWPGGERRADFHRRVGAALDRILASHSDGVVVAVAHGGTLRTLLALLLPSSMSEWWTYKLDNCGLTQVALEDGQASLVLLNDTAHLPVEEGRD
jgi:broad specificity phosphatase PhoE